MNQKRKWIFKDFKAKLNELEPHIKAKAIEIAHTYMKSGNFSEKEAIEKGIIKAEEGFYDLEG